MSQFTLILECHAHVGNWVLTLFDYILLVMFCRSFTVKIDENDFLWTGNKSVEGYK